MPVSIKGSGGGSVTLDAGAAAADTTLTLPNTTGTVALTASPTFTGTVTIPTLSVTNNETVGGTLSVTGTSTLTGTVTATTITSPSATALTLQYGGTTGATLDTSGNLLLGTTSLIISGSKLNISGTASGFFGLVALVNTTSSTKKWSFGPDSAGNFVVYNDATVGMFMAYGATSWTSTSDERLKTDLLPIENAVTKIMSLRAVTGRYKIDENNVRRAFLIAQDVQTVFPEAVNTANPNALGLQYSDVIPLLVASIKELSAKNDALEARLAALEAK